ncbi:MAG TPA: helix-turn-helix transcriptional regulator [Sphingomicrobium sp.]|jgi:transcriptional regulator with XRE-family HTH domain|nr:helix-turn-helix transcriptional regulator [Sphingomicrobium sp.]
MQTIRALRQERGWTQFELALKVGVQPQAVYLWESGRRVPQVPQLRKLGQVFGLCSDDIDLETIGDDVARAPASHQPRAERRRGERAPGRDQAGRPVVRNRESGAP